MLDVIEQDEMDNHTKMVLKKNISSTHHSTSCNQACTTTKGLRTMTFILSPFVNISLLGKNHEKEQASMKEFFHHNPMPAHVEDNVEDVCLLVCSATAPPTAPMIPMLFPATAILENPPHGILHPAHQNHENLQQVPNQPTKIVVKSRDHKKSVDLAKLQNGMLQLMYASGKINWDDGIVKNICTSTLTQGFKNLLTRLASVQATQLSILFATIFQPNLRMMMMILT